MFIQVLALTKNRMSLDVANNTNQYKACENCKGRSMTFRNSKKKRGPLRLLFNKCLVCDGSGLVSSTKLDSLPLSISEKETSPLIAISGCGIGGMALAIALSHRGHRVVIYERDTHFSFRKQGYGLTIQQGMHALSQLGLTAYGISSTAHFSISPDGSMLGCYGRALTKDNIDGEDVTFSTNAEIRHNIHLPRQRLRALLLNALPPGTVRWGVTVDDFEEIEESNDKEQIDDDNSNGDSGGGGGCGGSDGGGVRLTLSTKEVVNCAVLVGADGIFSNVRKLKAAKRHRKVMNTDTIPAVLDNNSLLPDEPLVYLGCIVILGYASITHPLFSHRIVQVLDGANRIYTMPFSGRHGFAKCFGCEGDVNEERHLRGECKDSTMWQFSFPVPTLAEARELSAKGPAFLRQETIRRCAQWQQPIIALLAATRDEDVSGYPAFDRPISLRPLMPPALSRVVLLGDAAHPMSPFKGQGANQALLDGLALAKWIHESDIGWPKARQNQSTSSSTSTSGKKRGRSVEGDEDQKGGQNGEEEINETKALIESTQSTPHDKDQLQTECETVNEGNKEIAPVPPPIFTIREVVLDKPFVAPNCSVMNPFFKDTVRTPTIQEALSYFEEEMMVRVTPKVKQSRDAVAALHSPSALAPANCTRATAALVVSASDESEKRRYELGVLSEEQFIQAREALERALQTPVIEEKETHVD